MSKNGIVSIGDGIYQIKYYWLEVANVYAFLVGEERALLIDSAYATTEVKTYVESVTSLPVTLVNTHGHFDHIGSNSDFDQAYLEKADWGVADEHSDYIVDEKDEVAFEIDAEIISGQLIEIIERVAERMDVTVIDVYEVTANHPEYFPDGIHPNKEGNKCGREDKQHGNSADVIAYGQCVSIRTCVVDNAERGLR